MKLCLLFVALLGVALAENWAVLVAGSEGYHNYRHQANMCGAHQIVKNKGIKPENIITMVYDDVAYSEENPHKGMLFNEPNGPDVHEGCEIDYKGKDVNKDNFFAVLKGDSEATGGKKVLKSTSEDKVFVYYNDHGNTGIIAMPGHQTVYADELLETLQYMHKNNMYSELLWYTSACYSGSLWKDQLPEDIGVFATTSANYKQSSYGRWCGPPDDVIRGVSLGACLSDEYTSNWMKDTKTSPSSRTIIE